jgi:hypothetical protein
MRRGVYKYACRPQECSIAQSVTFNQHGGCRVSPRNLPACLPPCLPASLPACLPGMLRCRCVSSCRRKVGCGGVSHEVTKRGALTHDERARRLSDLPPQPHVTLASAAAR